MVRSEGSPERRGQLNRRPRTAWSAQREGVWGLVSSEGGVRGLVSSTGGLCLVPVFSHLFIASALVRTGAGCTVSRSTGCRRSVPPIHTFLTVMTSRIVLADTFT